MHYIHTVAAAYAKMLLKMCTLACSLFVNTSLKTAIHYSREIEDFVETHIAAVSSLVAPGLAAYY